MGKDLYNLLKVGRNATEDEIRKSYKKLALKLHPDKNSDPDAVDLFREVAEAYEILSNNNKRAIYDKWGEAGLKNGKNSMPGKKSHSFKGAAEPTSHFNSYNNNNKNGYFTSTRGLRIFTPIFSRYERPVQDPPVEFDMYVTLEEIFTGCVKKMRVSRWLCDPTRHEFKIFLVQIKPGTKNGTKFVFKREGDRNPGKIPADIVFVLREKHSIFIRCGNDIHYKAKITLREALCGTMLAIPTLRGELVPLRTNGEIIKPNSLKCLMHEGMPNPKRPMSRGNLIVSFIIIFPKTLSEGVQKAISVALPD